MKVGIVGAGITGLTTARDLLRRGVEVAVYDAGEPGGLAGGFEFPDQPGVYLEKYYHHIFRSDRHVVELINDLGLGGDLQWLPSRSGVYAQGRTWPMEGPLDLLRFSPAGSLLERLKLGLSLRVFQKTADWKPFDAITCEEFFRSRNNLLGYEGMWEPLLKAKWGEHWKRAPAAFLWGRIYPRANSREKGKESLGYLRGGFARMFFAFTEQLEKQGVQFHFRTPVTSIRREGANSLALVTPGGEEKVDRVIWTSHPRHLAQALDPPEPRLTQFAQGIDYIGACCLVLISDRPWGDFYWINNIDPTITFGGAIEHTNLVGTEDYGGKHVMYVINYLDPKHPLMEMDADQVFAHHLPSLKRLYPNFDPAHLSAKYLFKSPVASPLYDVGFLQRIPPFVGWSPGIGILGMAQVYPIDRNMNHCMQVVEEADMGRLLAPMTN